MIPNNDRQYPEQFDKNLLCTHENGEFRFPARVSIAVTHLLARGNADGVENFDAIVIGCDKNSRRPFISTTLDPAETVEALHSIMHQMLASIMMGKQHQYLKDADPDSSPKGDSK